MKGWREMTNARRAGILGTVCFHLLAAIAVVGLNISRETVHEGMEIAVETPVEEAAPREARGEEGGEELSRSIAVNEEIAAGRGEDAEREIERYIAGIREELREEARDGRYAARKDERREADSLQALEARRQRALDSLQSAAYGGESSVTYRLAGRFKVFLPVPVFRCEFGGTVVVSIAVNPRGEVVKAEVVDKESKDDACLREVAAEAARHSRFNAEEKAPARQAGTITYHFVKQ
ncbi:MAG: energy transducer TonB [Odoribacteraceae bacterium]|jgi:TonB family protein|nr:energy transducer TonB [Odoribacteraceae bacterium]